MKPRKYIIVSLIVAGVLLGLAFILGSIDETRIVARAVAPDGTEFCIVQEGAWYEFSDTSCYSRKKSRPWRWYYYNHEDWFWPTAKVKIDNKGKRIIVYRNGKVDVTFNWETERLQTFRDNIPHEGANNLMPVGWDFPDLKK
jgi:hypothetical protein